MKIYTKKGDNGQTSLIGGTIIPKYHIRINAYGTVDELNSFIGLLRDKLNDEHTRTILLTIQKTLFTIGTNIASDPNKINKENILPLREEEINILEKEIDLLNEILPQLRNFIIPGGHEIVSQCHICRSVCRRTERIVLKLNKESKVDTSILKYLNRLSDYLFTLSRWASKNYNAEKIIV